MSNIKELPFNWHVYIVCVDCGAEYKVDNPKPSLEVLEEKRIRVVLLYVPNECPTCHSFRVVKGTEKPRLGEEE